MDSKYVKKIKYATYFIGSDGNSIHNCDEVFEKMTGYSRDDIRKLGLKQTDLICEEDREAYLELVTKLLNINNEAFLEHRLRRKDGQIIYVFCLGHAYENGWVIRIADMTDAGGMNFSDDAGRDNNDAALLSYRKSAFADDTTGLMLRGAFEETVKEFLPECSNCALFLIDIDSFKHVNDEYGHLIGDDVIAGLSSLLCKTVRGNDIVCRTEGDSFAIFLRDMKNINIAVMVAQRILSAVDRLKVDKCNNLHISVSIGIKTVVSGAGVEYDSLYSAADAALYQAKINGKGRYVLA